MNKCANSFELMFIFKNVKFNVDFEDGYFDDEEKKEILSIIKSLSGTMTVDKTYVECLENLRNTVFMVEDGWNSLHDMLIDTEYGKYLHPNNHAILVDAFTTIARCYMYECISAYTDKCQHISITIDTMQDFDVIICKDTSDEWKKYPGKWQDWEFDSAGKIIKKTKNVNKDKDHD